MRINAKNTEDGRPETVELDRDDLPAIAGFNQAINCGLILTLTHTPNRLSHFAFLDLEHGDYLSEMFNDESAAIRVAYLSNLCRKFHLKSFRLWKQQQTDEARAKFLKSPQTYSDCVEYAKATISVTIPPDLLK